MSDERYSPGKTTIAPDVLVSIARLTSLSIEGVSRMAAVPGKLNKLVRKDAGDGVQIFVENNTVYADIYVVLHRARTREFLGRGHGDHAAAVATLAAARAKIVDGTSVIFFPEGTRSRDGRLLPFKRGAFRMALDLGLPILPLTVAGTRDVLPAGTSYVSSNAAQGSYSPSTGEWNVGTVPPGSDVTLYLVGKVTNPTAKVNAAELIAADQFDPDSAPGNNIATEDDQASITATPQTVDLSLAKVVDNPAPNVGDEITFAVGINNAGPDEAVRMMAEISARQGGRLGADRLAGMALRSAVGVRPHARLRGSARGRAVHAARRPGGTARTGRGSRCRCSGARRSRRARSRRSSVMLPVTNST